MSVTEKPTAKDLPLVLVGTKLHLPTPPPDSVERHALLERVVQPAGSRVSLVCAAAGFGKTTLAAQWAARAQARCAWLSLDPHDGDPLRFARYLVASLRGALGGCMERSQGLIDAAASAPWPYLVEVMAADAALLEHPVLVVLDDYHLVASEPVDLLVARLVECLPPPVHLVVLSRSEPAWPLAQWRARGWLREFRDADLRFSLDETRSFFASQSGPDLRPKTIESLQQRTEGWIAGLRLAALSLAGAERPDERVLGYEGLDFRISEYLLHEVLGDQLPDVRELMGVAALLGEFCAPLCEHVLREPGRRLDVESTLAALASHNRFLVPLDAERRWYRFHHLFRDFLRERAHELVSPDVRRRLHDRAGQWNAEHGRVESALRHWIAAGEIDRAADLLGENIEPAIRADPSRRTLAGWLDQFPPGAERGRLPLLVAHGHLRNARFDVAGIAELLAEVDRLPSVRGSPFEANVEGLRAFVAYWTGAGERALEHARRALAARPPMDSIAYVLGNMYAAGGLNSTGRRNEALRLLDRAYADVARAKQDPSHLLVTRGGILLYANELDEARRTMLALVARARRSRMPPFWPAFAHDYLGTVAYERNELDEAQGWFERIARQRYLVNNRMFQGAMVGLALLANAKGDPAALDAALAASREWALEAGDPLSLRIADSLELRLRPVAQESPAASGPPPPPIDHNAFWLEVPTVTWAERLLADDPGRAGDRALPYVDAAIERMRRNGNQRQATALALVRAMALDAAGRRETGLEQLEQVLREAEPRRLVRTFLDRGPRLKALLDALAARGGRDAYRDRLRDAFVQGDASLAPGAHGTAPCARALSYRELDVLRLLSQHMSNKQIAARLSVSPEAIKKRAASIYRKLGVGSRGAAVAVARERGLIEPSD